MMHILANATTRTHPVIAESNSTFYQGSVVPSFSLDQATMPPFPAPPFLPALSSGGECFPVTDKASVTHLSSKLSLPPPPEADTVPYARTQGISNPDWLGFDSSTATGSSSLPVARPSLSEVPSHEEYRLPPLRYLIQPAHSASMI